jgi:basic membrane protein A
VGVDVDQSFLGPHILTSAVIRLDKGVFAIVQRLAQGRLTTGGGPVLFDVRNGGVGLGTISPKVQEPLRRSLERIRRAIVAGKIRVPRST